jgi:hypothetical protein
LASLFLKRPGALTMTRCTSRLDLRTDPASLAQIGEEPRSFSPSGRTASSWLMKASSSLPVDALRVGGPVTPVVGWLEGGPELLAGVCHLLSPLDLKVIQEFQEHDPGQQRQTVEGPLHHVATTQTNLRVRSSNLFGRANDFNHLRAAHHSKTKIRTVFRGRLEKCPPLSSPNPKGLDKIY